MFQYLCLMKTTKTPSGMLSETTGVVKTRPMPHTHRKPAMVTRCKDSVIIIIILIGTLFIQRHSASALVHVSKCFGKATRQFSKRFAVKILCKITHSHHKNLNLNVFIQPEFMNFCLQRLDFLASFSLKATRKAEKNNKLS